VDVIRWEFHPFVELTPGQLYEILALRESVFVVEQRCPYLDADGRDAHAWHLMGRDETGRLIAYLRIVRPGHRFPEPSIGRVVTSPQTRGCGIGRVLMAEGITRCEAVWPGRGIRISAQAHLAPFYRSLGFATIGDEYLEDNIPHVEMLKGPA